LRNAWIDHRAIRPANERDNAIAPATTPATVPIATAPRLMRILSEKPCASAGAHSTSCPSVSKREPDSGAIAQSSAPNASTPRIATVPDAKPDSGRALPRDAAVTEEEASVSCAIAGHPQTAFQPAPGAAYEPR
jgi:hypothetical protein